MTDVVETQETEVEQTLNKYKLHITGSDSIGLNFVENVVAMANLGAVIEAGTYPTMRFPHGVTMVLESETPPTPSAVIRVFEYDSHKEVFAAFIEPVSSGFSLDTEDAPVVDKSTNAGVPWTKEQLLAMDFQTELRAVCEAVGVTGRGKDKMIKEYLAKFE